jgi:V/A-type H+-transporting ATPase subunit D
MLKARAASVERSRELLVSRRQALMREFLGATVPFLRSTEELRTIHGEAIRELSLGRAREGREFVESIAEAVTSEAEVEITPRMLWGVRYKDVVAHESALRQADERGYDYSTTSPHIEDAIGNFERLVDAVVANAGYEQKLRRLADEIQRTTRKVRVIEQVVEPGIRAGMRFIEMHLEEREREERFRVRLGRRSRSARAD